MDLEEKVKQLVNQNNHEDFIFDFLLLYGLPKVTVTKAKNSRLNKADNQIIIKKKLFFEFYDQGTSLFEAKTADLLERIETLKNDPKTFTHDPRFIIVTNYKRFLAVDTKTKDTRDIEFKDLWKHTDFFLPWSGKEKYQPHVESMADVKAAEKMAKIYDEIYHNNKTFAEEYNHDLNIFLTRLLFCFFAEDTGIFDEENLFTKAMIEHTNDDGSDLQAFFETLFEALDKQDKSEYPQYIQKFPYVNGKLFRDRIHIPELTAKTRELMIECGDRNNWKEINPDIFGSMFQAVKTAEVRSGLGQHYTSVPNIMKVINPLFMDDLREEFEKAKDSVNKLKSLQLRLSKIRIFDPACGSGNFLIIAFKQMKLLEMDIIKRIQEVSGEKDFQMNLSVIELKQFYGIEIDDFACEIARLSLWLAEHQMNCKFKEEFGVTRPTLPLCESGHIVCGNALRLDWEQVCPKFIEKSNLIRVIAEADVKNTPLHLETPKEQVEVYILGNPPYEGARKQSPEQKADMDYVFNRRIEKYNNLDYIAGWFWKGKQYIENTKSVCAFVTTNSINQGDQVSLLWPHILTNGVEIKFAYTSFKWSNNAKYNAGVTCNIIGLSVHPNKKTIYTAVTKHIVDNINAYIIAADNIYIYPRKKPLSAMPSMCFGSMPNDGGFLILNSNEYKTLTGNNHFLQSIIKKYVGSDDYINSIERYCLWINKEQLTEAMKHHEISTRISNVKDYRLKSKREATQKLANYPYRFGEVRYKNTNSIIVPRVSSERRIYIPLGFLDAQTVISDAAQAIYDAEPWIFGVVTSLMHMVWVRAVAGRLKTDYRYSAELCYNTFPFPKITDQQKKRIELCVQDILRVREKYSQLTMAELYDPDKMPKDLLEAHHSLDMVIESCYRRKPFENDEQRLAHLFKMYEMMTNNASEEELKQLELGL